MDTGQCVVNMINCRRGEHCLFRSFGLGDVTDQVGRLRKSQISQEVAKWYPNAASIKIEAKEGDEYQIQITGGE